MDRAAVGKRIRELRRRYGLSGKNFAEKLGFSPAAISKFERGLLRPSQEFVERTITALELPKNEALALQELCALFESQFRRWSAEPEDLERNQELIGQRERNSTVIRSYWDQIIPGLLQEEQYMRAILRSFASPSTENIDKVVRARQRRQRILSNQRRTFIFIITEGCLRNCIHLPEVMVKQLTHLELMMGNMPSVELRILPFEKPLTRISLHHFILYDERSVEIEVNKGQLDLWTDEDVKFHIELMNYLVASSLPPAKSLEVIRHIKSIFSTASGSTT